jgi:membrane-bound lytic murein transglycosylase B
MRIWKFIVPLSIACVISASTWAAPSNWTTWLAAVRTEALDQGISPEVFDAAFSDVHEPSRQIKGLAHSQPEHRLSYLKYRNSRVDSYRITIGRKKFKEYHDLLESIGTDYGVDPCFILAFWGLETSYGSYMGTFPVIKSLATLAYDSNRPEFFRRQLFIALSILNEGHVSLAHFKGEWAGASGHPQFLPSSWVEYAVDYDGDGHKDIWDSKPDALASIANYMKKNGWHTGEPWAIFVKLPPHFDESLKGKTIIKPTREWNAMGVRTEDGQPLPHADLMASIIQPDGGPVFLAYPNYKMILKYNNSIYYAGAIGYLADKICLRIP